METPPQPPQGLSDPLWCPAVNLMFLMSYWCVNRSTSEGAEALHMALHTLRMMALGGIHDHVSQVPAPPPPQKKNSRFFLRQPPIDASSLSMPPQGFHRYSTDSSWHVPHFEKMLYDQAQLAIAYITASQVRAWTCHPPPPRVIHRQREAIKPLRLTEDRSEAANGHTS